MGFLARTRYNKAMTIYTPELGDKVLSRISAGELLFKICEEQEMPAKSTVYLWSFSNKEFGEKFRAALVQRAENWGEGIMEDIIACPERPEALAKAKLLVDTKKWIMGKLLKTYADKVTVQGDKDNPIQLTLATALDARIAAAKAAPMIEHEAASSGLPVIDVE